MMGSDLPTKVFRTTASLLITVLIAALACSKLVPRLAEDSLVASEESTTVIPRPPTRMSPTQPSPALVSSPAPGQECTTPATPLGFQTYQDEIIRIAIDFPSTWTLFGSSPGIIAIIQSYPASSGQGSEGQPPGETKCDLVIFPEGETLDTHLQAVRDNRDLQIISEQEWHVCDVQAAIRLQLRSDYAGEHAVYLARLDDRVVKFVCYGDLAAFDQIAQTLRTSP